MRKEFDWVIGFACGGVALIFLLFCVVCCCVKKRKDETDGKQSRRSASSRSLSSGYSKVPKYNEVESGQEEGYDAFDGDEKEGYFMNASPSKQQQPPVSVHIAVPRPPRHEKVDSVANYDESMAEPSMSDFDNENVSVSAYGDRASIVSHGSNTSSWVFSNTSIQMSLIYSRDMKYVAGKIIQIDGLTFPESTKALLEVKGHVVVLPVKKYALKTDWYPIKNNKSKIDEYFKFKFKRLPIENQISFRFRVYGRKTNFSRSTCIGECFVNLREIVTSRGGLTIWRPLSKGAPETIIKEE